MNEWVPAGIGLVLFCGWVAVIAWTRRKPEMTPEEEGRADARRQYEVWKRHERAAAAFHSELARLKAEDPDRPEGRAS